MLAAHTLAEGRQVLVSNGSCRRHIDGRVGGVCCRRCNRQRSVHQSSASNRVRPQNAGVSMHAVQVPDSRSSQVAAPADRDCLATHKAPTKERLKAPNTEMANPTAGSLQPGRRRLPARKKQWSCVSVRVGKAGSMHGVRGRPGCYAMPITSAPHAAAPGTTRAGQGCAMHHSPAGQRWCVRLPASHLHSCGAPGPRCQSTCKQAEMPAGVQWAAHTEGAPRSIGEQAQRLGGTRPAPQQLCKLRECAYLAVAWLSSAPTPASCLGKQPRT